MTITLHHPNPSGNANNSNANSNNGDVLNSNVFAVSGVGNNDKPWIDTYKVSSTNLTITTVGNYPTGMDNETLNHNALPSDICDAVSFPYVDLTQSDVIRQTFVVIYIIVIVLSLFGNWMVIWTVIRNKHMRTVTNYYIVNLAVSDFLVAFWVMPLKLLEFTAPCAWHIFNGDAMCSFMSFVLPVFVFASVLTLVAISMER